MSDIFSVREATTKSAEWLKSRGIPSPRLDAELLLAEVLGVERLALFMDPSRPLSEEERDAYRALIRRRGDHEPVAYILGNAGFWDIEVDVDKRALIPRPDTEKIIEEVLKAAGDRRDAPLRIVDVGCGSGILGITLAKQFPQAQVVCIDVSQDALDLSAHNATKNGVRERLHFVRADLLEPLVLKGSRADIIVSNPPYIGESERDLMSRGVEEFEPTLALFAGEDGFEIIDRLLPQIPLTLAEGGLFVMEFGSPQGEGIRARARRRFRSWRVEKDWGGHDRVLVVDGPGERVWADKSDPESTAEGAQSPAETSPNDPLVDAQEPKEIAEDFIPADAFHQNARYGGADGTELLPEIDLHADED